MSIETLVDELTLEIKADEIDIRNRTLALDEKKVALRYLQGRMLNQVATPNVARVRLKLMDDTSAPDRKLSLAEAVVTVVKSMPDQDIYVAPVHDALLTMSVDMPDDSREARTRIGTQLNRLEDKGVLKKTFQGGGNVPNRYRLIIQTEELTIV